MGADLTGFTIVNETRDNVWTACYNKKSWARSYIYV